MSNGRNRDDAREDEDYAACGFLRELRDEGCAADEAMEALVEGLASAPLPPSLRARILASTRETPRFDFARDAVARLVDVSAARARELLVGVDLGESWSEGPLVGIGLYDFEGGPAVQGAVTGFIRMMPGTVFPHHEHVGEERVFVLSGSFRDSDGRTWAPGDLAVSAPGTSHSFEVLEGPELFYLVVVSGGVRIGGELFGPDDPRL